MATERKAASAGYAGNGFARPPTLAGYTYDPAEAYAARDAGRLLAVRLETNLSCNLRCRYCYAMSGTGSELDFDTLADCIDQAAELGARSVVIIGGGEPTLHSRFRDLVARVHDLGMRPMIFSNCMRINGELAAFLADHDASVMCKLDSLRPDVQDWLAGVDGAFERMQAGVDHLLEAGFGEPVEPGRLRLGASFVSCRANLDEIEAIWRWCRERNVFPNMEVLTPTGRAPEALAGQFLQTDEVQDYKNRLLDIDRADYGYDWLPHTPLTASGCLQHLYSLYITFAGDVRPCAPTKFDEHPALRVEGIYPHNVRIRTLREIHGDPLFAYVRNIDRYLEGRCASCEHLDQCIGCRGYAYSVGVNEGKAPLAALRGECLQCRK